MAAETTPTDWPYRAEMLKTLGHPVRLQIIAILCERDECVGALAAEIEASQASVSQQLSILRMRGFVSNIRVAGKAVYSLEEQRLKEIVKCLSGCHDPAGARALRAPGETDSSRSAAGI